MSDSEHPIIPPDTDMPKSNLFDKLNVLIVDDEVMVLGIIQKALEKRFSHIIGKIYTSEDPEEAIEILRTCQAKGVRDAVHLLLSDLDMGGIKRGITFLEEANEVYPTPYIGLISGKVGGTEKIDELKDIDELIDFLIVKSKAGTKEGIEEHLPKCRKYWERNIDNLKRAQSEQTESQHKAYKSAPNSPLPAIELPEFDPAKDNHDLRALETRLKGVYWVAPIDWDDTLYQTESENTIVLHQFAKYLRKHHSDDFGPENGNLEALDELIKYCGEWENERKMVSQGRENVKKRDYEKAIIKADKKAAAAFEKMHIDKLKEYGRQFVESEDFGGRFFEYTFPIIQKLRDHGILPVVVTGAPDFLVQALLQKAGLNYGNGTTYDTDDDGRLTGEILIHMGTAEGKRQLGEELVQKGYAVGVGMGNSEGDMGLFMRAANKDPIKHDVHGGGVLVNGTEAVEAEVERNYSEKRTKVIYSDPKKKTSKGDKTDDTIAAMGVVMKALFYPLHDYLIAKAAAEKGQPKLMEDLEKKLIEQKEKGQIDNIENIKRLRDALKDYGLDQDEITEALCDFLPEIVVKDVMKEDVLYLRDEGVVKKWLGKLQKIKELDIPITREMVAAILQANSILQARGGSIPPEENGSDQAPPSPPTYAEGFNLTNLPNETKISQERIIKILAPGTDEESDANLHHKRGRL